MNGVDVALVVLLGLFALRGFWRGFFRECFGLLALIGGLAAALRYAGTGAALLGDRLPLPELARLGIAFVGLFLVVYVGIALVGLLVDAVLGRRLLPGVNRTAGALFAAAKGAAFSALVLLFLHLFPLIPPLERQIEESRLARPMVTLAGRAIQAGLDRMPRAPRLGRA